MLGTIVNASAVVVGSLVGVMIHSRLQKRFQDMIFQGIGLVTMILGVSMALKTSDFLIVVVSILLGSITGELINIDKRLQDLTKRFIKGGNGANRAVQGFMTATLLFCVGSMTILGAIEDGMGQTPTLLYTKSIMDGVSSVAFAATFGIAVMFSALPLFLYQGTLTLCAAWITSILSDGIINELTAVGGVMLVGLGINILQIKEIRVTNMLPSLIFAIIFTFFMLG